MSDKRSGGAVDPPSHHAQLNPRAWLAGDAKQEAQLSQKVRAMLRVNEHFACSVRIIQGNLVS